MIFFIGSDDIDACKVQLIFFYYIQDCLLESLAYPYVFEDGSFGNVVFIVVRVVSLEGAGYLVSDSDDSEFSCIFYIFLE